jgi:hypothetical protein
MTHSKTPESDTQSTRQDALRFLREATFNSLARVNSPRVDAPGTPTTPKMIVSDLNDLDIKVRFFHISFFVGAHGLIRSSPILFASTLKQKNLSKHDMQS